MRDGRIGFLRPRRARDSRSPSLLASSALGCVFVIHVRNVSVLGPAVRQSLSDVAASLSPALAHGKPLAARRRQRPILLASFASFNAGKVGFTCEAHLPKERGWSFLSSSRCPVDPRSRPTPHFHRGPQGRRMFSGPAPRRRERRWTCIPRRITRAIQPDQAHGRRAELQHVKSQG